MREDLRRPTEPMPGSEITRLRQEMDELKSRFPQPYQARLPAHREGIGHRICAAGSDRCSCLLPSQGSPVYAERTFSHIQRTPNRPSRHTLQLSGRARAGFPAETDAARRF